MKKLIYLVVGIILGAILTVILIWNSMPKMMMVVQESKYDFQRTVDELVLGAYDNGWDVTHEIDIQERLSGFDYEMTKLQIIEICHGEHSFNVLQDDANKYVAGIMPCRFAVYETRDGKVLISKMNIGLMSKMFGGVIEEVMSEVSEEEKLMLERVIK